MGVADEKPVLIVGAGMAGLACALRLQDADMPFAVYEAGDEVGGRVRTDRVEGFLLDRGFQVYLDNYPRTGALLDLAALDLKPFAPGALVFRGGRLHRVMDVFRRPGSLLAGLAAPIGSVGDKIRVGRVRRNIIRSSFEEIASREDRTTESYLQDFGFSPTMIDSFFRSFYGGIFLERELRTSSRMFEFTFKHFAVGSATLPAKGMGEIPKQLAARISPDRIHRRSPVSAIEGSSLFLQNGHCVEGRAVVAATDGSAVRELLPDFDHPEPTWRSVTNLYFAAERSPVGEAIICLNGTGSGLVNNVCVLSDAAPGYAPEGQALLSVSALGYHEDSGLAERVRAELAAWFGPAVHDWRHLRTDRIRRALPGQPSGHENPGFIRRGNVWICGDHLSSASIEGAVVSGQTTAENLLAWIGQ